MKKAISVLIMTLLVTFSLMAQGKKKDTINIMTSAQCEMCKTRIESALAFEAGVVKSDLDLETKTITVVYKVGRTTPDKIREAITRVGYDADQMLANEEAYNKLPPCCKKPDDPDHAGH
jgi:copper chaperone CopZ